MNSIIEQSHRLELKEYRGFIRASFTCCIENRLSIFVNSEIVKEFTDILAHACEKYFCINWIYVFMPDHVHIVLEGTKANSDLWKTIVLFKQKTGYWFLKNMEGIKWQKDFYDHVHRHAYELVDQVRYIAGNPVRKDLVINWQDHLFTGSLHYDLHAIVNSAIK